MDGAGLGRRQEEAIMFAKDSVRYSQNRGRNASRKGSVMVSGSLATVYGATNVTTWTLAIVRAWFVAAIVATFSSPGLQAQAPPVGASGPRLNSEIVNAVEMYRRAAFAGDARAVAALYTEDGVELPACEPLVRGRAAIEQRYRKFFDGPVKRTAFTFSHLEATIEGKVGYAVGTSQTSASRFLQGRRSATPGSTS